MKDMMNVDDASEYLSIHRITLYNWARAKKVPHFKIGGKVLFGKEELDKWVESRLVKVK